jgi:hypothetical protein
MENLQIVYNIGWLGSNISIFSRVKRGKKNKAGDLITG